MNFDRLPELAQIRILSFVNVKERLRIKRLSKRVKSLIEQYFPLKSLCIYQYCKPAKVRWLFGEETIRDQEKVEVHFHKRKYDFDFSKAYFGSLRRLHVHNLNSSLNQSISRANEYLMKHIQFLGELEVLSLHNLPYFEISKLSLNKLQVLFLRNSPVYSTSGPFDMLDMPNLREFNYSNTRDHQTKTRFRSPEKLEVLRCPIFDRNYAANALTGLKRLICQDVDDSFRLEELPSLQVLEAFPTNQETIEILQNIARSHRRLKVFVFGFRLAKLPVVLATTDPFKSRENYYELALPRKFLHQIALNYSDLKQPSSWPDALDYSALGESFEGRVPANFFALYPSIRALIINKRTDRFSLVRFLSKHGGIEELNLSNDCLGQEFFDELGAISFSLNSLTIRNFAVGINFSFVAKLKHLRDLFIRSESELVTEVSFPYEGLECLEHCKYLKRFSFNTRWHFAQIEIYEKRGKLYSSSVKCNTVYKGRSIRKAISSIWKQMQR